MKIIHIIFCLLLLSCGLEGLVEEGIGVYFSNLTDTEYESASLYVGAIKGNQFIVTDSIKSKGPIEIANDSNRGLIGFPDWNPNLKTVFDISDKGALYCYIEGGGDFFFDPFYKGDIKYNRFGGNSRAIVLKLDVSVDERDWGIEKQDFEKVK
jgi:hypothetical protein